MFNYKFTILQYDIMKRISKFKSQTLKIPNYTHQNYLLRNFCECAPILHPLELAYASYESTFPDIEESSRPPVIIMHGLLGSKSNWNSISKKMHHNTKRKIITIDARNHGDSPHSDEFSYPHLAEDVHLFMTNMSIQKATILGHSMGGRAMMFLALKYPDLVHSMIIVDISPVRIGSDIIGMTHLFNTMLSVDLNINESMSKARKLVEEEIIERVPDLYIRQFLLTNLVQIPGGTYKWRVNLNSVVKNFPEIMKFPVINGTVYNGPVLFVGGKKSNYLKPEDHRNIRKMFPSAEFKYIDGAGHWVHYDKPAEFLSTVCEFINDSR